MSRNLGGSSKYLFALFCLISVLVYFKFSPHIQRDQQRGSLGEYRSSRSRWIDDINNQTWGFEKLFVVGLPDRFDKKDVWSLASLASDVKIDWVDGVKGDEMTPKAIPAGWREEWTNNTLGCFRGHLNAVRRIIEEKLSSALIMEDDADWDVMMRSQLVEFARGSHFIQDIGDASDLHSPYGDDWDVLWIGHCGNQNRQGGDTKYWVTYNDPTVTPAEQSRWEAEDSDRRPNTSAGALQGNFTRIVYEARNFRCLYGYALSLRGAKKYLYHYSVEPHGAPADRALSGFCERSDVRCIAPWPMLIDEYHPAGPMSKDSDRLQLQGHRQTMRPHGVSVNIVFPVKGGLETFINDKDTWKSQWPMSSLWPSINPKLDTLPMGGGVVLSDKSFRSKVGLRHDDADKSKKAIAQ